MNFWIENYRIKNGKSWNRIFIVKSFPDADQSNDDNDLPNPGRKFHEATKTIMRRRSRYEKQINVSSRKFKKNPRK